MGGLSGAVSTKIAVQAGLLLVSARIDRHPVQAVLEPAAPHTRIAPALARWLRVEDGQDDADRPVDGRHAVGIDRREIRLRTIRFARSEGAAPLAIGNDLLRDSPLELDFARNHLHLLERSEVARAARGLVRVPLAVAPSGCLEAAATRADGTSAIVALASDDAVPGDAIPIRLGTAAVQAATPSAGAQACSTGSLALGWGAFGQTRIIIDLPGGSLWITPVG